MGSRVFQPREWHQFFLLSLLVKSKPTAHLTAKGCGRGAGQKIFAEQDRPDHKDQNGMLVLSLAVNERGS